MPVWIRERDSTSATADTPPIGSISSSLCRGNSSPTKPSRQRNSFYKEPKQDSLMNHFTKSGGKDKTRTPPSWISSLYSGKSGAGEASESGVHRDKGWSTDAQNKRKWSPDFVDKSTKQKKARNDEHTSFNLLSVFGQPPQSSLVLQPRTPPRRKAKVIGNKPAPAISPLKKRSLVVDSAKDVAVQQHRQWQRSSSPLQAIDNVVGQRKIITTPRASTGLTPSKLRHGYSMIAFDYVPNTENNVNGSEEMHADEEPEEQDGPSSPSEERQERAGSTPKLPFTRSPQSNKRIYAQETQPDITSPLQNHQTLREVEVPLADSDPLSTPPPSSPKGKETQIGEVPSSQTEEGGSFNVRDEIERPAEMESYVSEEEEDDFEERRGCRDETFKLPSSEDDFVTPIRPIEVKSRLRSNGKSPQRQLTVQRDDEVHDSGSETQHLSWKDEIVSDTSKKVSQRVSASWADVSRVWKEVDLGQENNAPAPSDQQRQSSLHSFGFETRSRPRKEKAVEVNRNIEFDSDEGVESDTEDDEEATQVLPWDDEDNDMNGDASLALSMLPSEGDLDSQMREFLDAI